MASTVLIVEAFYGGSHKQLVDLLLEKVAGCVLFTLPAKKWHWRMRTSALYFAQNIPANDNYRVLFSSSVLNLAELIALRPDLVSLKKVLYFHENQLVYPVRKQQERDFQYGYNQIISWLGFIKCFVSWYTWMVVKCMKGMMPRQLTIIMCRILSQSNPPSRDSLVADIVLFNSKFNMESFLTSIETFLKLMPDFRPKNIQGILRSKSKVLYYPVALIDDNIFLKEERRTELENCERAEFPADQETLHIVWPHRWEHDKDPELFFNTMFQLSDLGMTFRLSVLGQVFNDVPEIFSVAKDRLIRHIVHWGYQESQEEYLNVLKHADVVVSTAKHEFFGVAMLEAVCCKCLPLCPNRLVYPEIFPKECLYNTEQQLFKRLKQFIAKPTLVRQTEVKIDISKFAWSALQQQYKDILQATC